MAVKTNMYMYLSQLQTSTRLLVIVSKLMEPHPALDSNTSNSSLHVLSRGRS